MGLCFVPSFNYNLTEIFQYLYKYYGAEGDPYTIGTVHVAASALQAASSQRVTFLGRPASSKDGIMAVVHELKDQHGAVEQILMTTALSINIRSYVCVLKYNNNYIIVTETASPPLVVYYGALLMILATQKIPAYFVKEIHTCYSSLKINSSQDVPLLLPGEFVEYMERIVHNELIDNMCTLLKDNMLEHFNPASQIEKLTDALSILHSRIVDKQNELQKLLRDSFYFEHNKNDILKELKEFITLNKHAVLGVVSSNRELLITVQCPVYFIKDGQDFINTRRDYPAEYAFYNGVMDGTVRFMLQATVRLDQPVTSYEDVTAPQHSTVFSKHVALNPHMHRFNCWSSARANIATAYLKQDVVALMNYCITSAGALDPYDGLVFSLFRDAISNNEHPPFEAKIGTTYQTFKTKEEYYEALQSFTRANQQSSSTDNQATGNADGSDNLFETDVTDQDIEDIF